MSQRQPTAPQRNGAGRPCRGEERRSPATLRPHPDAKLLPPLGAAEYKAFVADVAERGLTTPLVINPAGVVFDGHNQLRAAIELGLPTVAVRVIEVEDERGYMLRAAIRRRNLSPQQKAAVAIELVDYDREREQADMRRRANLQRGAEVATLPPRGKTRDEIARVAGCSARTVQDVITVKDEHPDRFEQVKAGTLSAHQQAQEIRRQRRVQALAEAPPLPERPYPVIYADPPWRSDNPDAPWAPENHYPTMELVDIKALPVPSAPDALLLLWAVNAQLPQALDVMSAWGFTYKGNLVWVKPSPGLGRRIRNQHELLLLGVKGGFPCPSGSDVPASVVTADRGRHSEKPEIFYELIERMYPACPKLELFARTSARPGWTVWGNEAQQ